MLSPQLQSTVNQMVQAYTNNFGGFLQASDLNHDGSVDRQELTNVLMQANTPYHIAIEMVEGVFGQLDRNRDGRLSLEDVQGQVPHMQNQIAPLVEQMIQDYINYFEQVLQGTDANRDRRLDRQEVLNVLVAAQTPWHIANEMVNGIFQRLDRNQDGFISIEEVQGQMPHMGAQIGNVFTSQQMQPSGQLDPRLQNTVNQMVQAYTNNFGGFLQGSDLNQDGAVDRQELITVLLQAGTPQHVAIAMVDEIFRQLDRNHDQRISIHDIQTQAPYVQNNIAPLVEQLVQEYFTNFNQVLQGTDANRNGMIDRQELLTVLIRANTPQDMAYNIVNEVFLRLDRDHDQQISIQDLQGQMPNMGHFVGPEIRRRYRPQSNLSVTDLDSIDTWGERTQQDGRRIWVDNAQIKAGEYHINNLKKSLENKWRDKFGLQPDPHLNNPQVEAIRTGSKYKPLYTEMSKRYCAQVVADGVQNSKREVDKEAVRTWDMCKVNYLDANDHKSHEFGELFNQLYRIAYLENAQGQRLNAYINDGSEKWALEYYNYYMGRGQYAQGNDGRHKFLRDMHNLQGGDAAQAAARKIKSVVTKLELLAPYTTGRTYAKEVQELFLSDLILLQSRHVVISTESPKDIEIFDAIINQLRVQNSNELTAILHEVEEQLDRSNANSVRGSGLSFGNKWMLSVKLHLDPAIVQNEPIGSSRFRTALQRSAPYIFNSPKGALFFEFIAVCFGIGKLSTDMIAGGDTAILGRIDFGSIASAFLANAANESIQGLNNFSVMILHRIAPQLENLLNLTIEGTSYLQRFLTNFSGFYRAIQSALRSAQGAAQSFNTIFGRNLTLISRIAAGIGLAASIVAFGVAAYQLVDAFKKNDTEGKIFGFLNAAVALGGVVAMVGVMASAAWAGPVGWLVAAAGAIVALVQLIIALTKKPPPTPVQEYTNQVMRPGGYLLNEADNRFYYAVPLLNRAQNRSNIYKIHAKNFQVKAVDFYANDPTFGRNQMRAFDPHATCMLHDANYLYFLGGIPNSGATTSVKISRNNPQQIHPIFPNWPFGREYIHSCCLTNDGMVHAIVADLNGQSCRIVRWPIAQANPTIEHASFSPTTTPPGLDSGYYSTTDSNSPYRKVRRLATDGETVFMVDGFSMYAYHHTAFHTRNCTKVCDIVYRPTQFSYAGNDSTDLRMGYSPLFSSGRRTLYAAMGIAGLYRVDIDLRNYQNSTASLIHGDHHWLNASFVVQHETLGAGTSRELILASVANTDYSWTHSLADVKPNALRRAADYYTQGKIIEVQGIDSQEAQQYRFLSSEAFA
ncbi:MAG: hypothetical protein F6J87_06935 [Spirulina sp. SIO3F2]|nr:hypothetical protein [Spirulina sp. SIO3F2]